MHRLKEMKDRLVNCVETQLGDISHVDTHELGEAIDMIKDLEQAMYYCSIVKAMEKQEEDEEFYRKLNKNRDIDRDMGRMYFMEPDEAWVRNRLDRDSFADRRRGENSERIPYKDRSDGMPYREREVPFELRDSREGRSPMSRRNYMEAKELHKDKPSKMRELEKYMQELSQDIVEMVEDSSPEEKQLLEKKISSLASKIAQLNV